MPSRTWMSAVVGCACLLTVAAGAPPHPTVDRWIADLSAADPAVRDAATAALVRTGPAGRPAVIAALPTASPEAAVRLSNVLLRTVPWDTPPAVDPLVRPIFNGYANLNADGRSGRAVLVDGPAAGPAMVRILTADPDPAVRWSAANALRLLFTDHSPVVRSLADQVLDLSTAPAGAGTYPSAATNGPLLAAAGWAAQSIDPARADALVDRALAIEVANPSAFRGQADFAFLWSADRAADRGDYATAVARFRQLVSRTAWTDGDLPDSVADLFAMQAEHGPLPGFVDDLRLNRAYLTRPELIYCLARAAERQGGTVGMAAGVALDAAAMAAGGGSVDAHCAAGVFLFRHGWPDAADRELAACQLLSGSDPRPDLYFALHAIADDRDDDAAAGRYLESALRRSVRGGLVRVTRYGEARPWSEAQAWAEVHWHYLRAAVTAGDRSAALAQAKQLLDLDADSHVLSGETGDPGMAADVVPVLADAGRATDADRCFAAAYAALSKRLAEAPGDAMPKNNLAWLCARSDRHLDQADRLSAAAVSAEPTDAACLDTRAEVLLRLGRSRESVDLEERALAAKPEDVYMQRQLARFRAAAAVTGQPRR